MYKCIFLHQLLLNSSYSSIPSTVSKISSHLLLHPPLILHQWLRVNLHVLHFSFLLLYQRGAGHAEDAMDVHPHLDLHLGAVSVWLGRNVLDRKASWGQIERVTSHIKKLRTRLQQGSVCKHGHSILFSAHLQFLYKTLIVSNTVLITDGVVWVWELLRITVKGFKGKWFLLVKGDDFGKWSSVILREHLALSERNPKVFQSKKKKQKAHH